ncbi:hypothetical protein PybrP1_002823, partial [[Pythium] brassicae (nom. inval.)]
KEPLDKDVHGSPLSGKANGSAAVESAPSSQEGGNEALYNTPKTSLDDFELLKVIGKGSYGKVTLVRKKDSKRLFAMKSLNKSNVKRRNQVEHTRTERREGITDGAEGTNSMCGTPEYLPPEILDRKLFDRVRNAPLTFPDEVGASARSLISGLLTRDPNERLGSRSADDVKNHEFFSDINWDDLYARKISPPFNPCESTSNFEETKNFEPEFTKMQINSVENSALGSLRVSDASRPSMTFQGFTYNTPNDLSMGTSVGQS